MSSKPDPQNSKEELEKPVQKSTRPASETSRLFIDVDEMIRHPQVVPPTRYVE
jgi:hypothetical protein